MLPSIRNTSPIQRQPAANPIRFGGQTAAGRDGGNNTPQFGTATRSISSQGFFRRIFAPFGKWVDKLFNAISKNRTREMLAEDFVGFGALRGAMDLLRGLFFGTGGLNIPAATERLAREGLSIFTDNVLAGISALGFGKLMDGRKGAYSNKWTDFSTLELFQKLVKTVNLPPQTSSEVAGQIFINKLAEQILAEHPERNSGQCLKILQEYWKNPQAKDKAALAAKLAKNLELDSFDLKLKAEKEVFQLDNLLEDIGLFKKQVAKLMEEAPKKANGGGWQQKIAQGGWKTAAEHTLQATLKVKNGKLGFVALGMAATFAVPSLITAMTRKFFKVDYYPGEMGIRKNEPKKQQEQGKHFQYVRESWNNGNKWPLLFSLAPLPIAAGVFDTVRWKFQKPFSTAWRKSFDFCKGAPFTTQQQMAATFALLITSRWLEARSDNEFRERMVDSGLGWALWILGTPLIKRAIAGYLDNNRLQAPLLLKNVPIRFNEQGEAIQHRKMLRSADEVEKLTNYLPNLAKNQAERAAKYLKRINRGSVVASMLLLGVVEPFIAIQWTKKNTQKKAATQQAQAMPNPAPTQFPSPAATAPTPQFLSAKPSVSPQPAMAALNRYPAANQFANRTTGFQNSATGTSSF